MKKQVPAIDKPTLEMLTKIITVVFTITIMQKRGNDPMSDTHYYY